MADLIIKPNSASGDKLIIQDRAGGAVLTTADSGATVANATLTAPTIASMANCTFPAGHIIQIVQGTDTDNGTSDVSSYSNTLFDNLNTEITPAFSSSKILVMLSIALGHVDNDTGHVRLVRDPTGTPVALAVGPADGSSTSASISIRLSSVHCMTRQNLCYLDSPATTSAVTYGVQGFTSGSQHGVFGYNQPENTSTGDSNMGRHMSMITLMEVAQ